MGDSPRRGSRRKLPEKNTSRRAQSTDSGSIESESDSQQSDSSRPRKKRKTSAQAHKATAVSHHERPEGHSHRRNPVRKKERQPVYSEPMDEDDKSDYNLSGCEPMDSGSDFEGAQDNGSAGDGYHEGEKATESQKPGRRASSKGERPRPSNLKPPRSNGLAEDLPPIFDINEIFADIAQRANNIGFKQVLSAMKGKKLRVATMCSGTDSPILALEMLSEMIPGFNWDHVFSAEVAEYKQAFIQRNFNPPLLFRDIMEFLEEDVETKGATTVFGRKAPVPGDIDLLVAGFVCKDRSNVNNHKKELNEAGETSDTLKAIIAYAKKYHPKIVVLENVVGKMDHWPQIQEDWKAVGYVSDFTKVDTKNYYIPQTRNRTYMACLYVGMQASGKLSKDKARKAEARKEKQLHDIKKWAEYLHAFKRPASSSVESFMLADADPKTQHMRMNNLFEHETRQRKWELCSKRHENMRTDYMLGDKHPFSRLDDDGRTCPPAYVDRLWFYRQPRRVWDSIDIHILRNGRLERHSFDSQEKLRVWELSQNVDHGADDNHPYGIVTCILPNAFFYVSNRGGPLNGYEALSLQGIPIDRISLTIETEKQVMKMAGEGMTTTVVAAAMLAALVTALLFFDTLGVDDSPPTQPRKMRKYTAPKTINLEKSILRLEKPECDLGGLLLDAGRSTRRCYCEEQDLVVQDIWQCKLCGHTACSSCRGNPQHMYELWDDKQLGRLAFKLFIQKLRQKLPNTVMFKNTESLMSKLQAGVNNRAELNKVLPLLEKAILEEFTMQNPRRSVKWSVKYESSSAVLELKLNEEEHTCAFYIKAPAGTPMNDDLHQILLQPMAIFSHKNLYEPRWSLRVPQTQGETEFTLCLTNVTGFHKSWRARLGYPDHQAEKVPQAFSLRFLEPNQDKDLDVLEGDYTHLPLCGTACDFLYRNPNGVCLFLNPTKIGPANEDCLVFSRDHHRLLSGDYPRRILAKVAARFRPWDIAEGEDKTYELQCSTDGRWIDAGPLCLETSRKDVEFYTAPSSKATTWQRELIAGDCGNPKSSTLMRCCFELPQAFAKEYKDCQSATAREKLLLSRYSSIIALVQDDRYLEDWITVKHLDQELCAVCAPRKPPVQWVKLGGLKGQRLVGLEHSEEAGKYEAALKSLSPVFKIRARIEDGSHESHSPSDALLKAHIEVEFNLKPLLHRARAGLNCKTGLPKVCWKLVKDSENEIFTPRPFKLIDNSSDKPYDIKLPGSHTLDIPQQRSLRWMMEREEHDSKPFTLTEIEESALPGTRWSARAMASQEVRHVRGGCLADTVSYGKTVLILSLAHAEFESHTREEIKKTISTNSTGLLCTAATLIICQRTLPSQWRAEIDKILPRAYDHPGWVIVIKTIKEWRELEAHQIVRAKFVVLNWNVLTDEDYVEALADFTGILVPDMRQKNSAHARFFSHWLDVVVKQMPSSLQELQKTSPKNFFNHRHDRLQKNSSRPEFQGVMPSVLHTGKKYIQERDAAKTGKKGRAAKLRNPKDKPNQPEGDWSQFRGPPLHMFHYNRIVVDEFSYLEADKKLPWSVGKLHGEKKWILSGTPRLESFIDVKRMASLLDLDLGAWDCTPGIVSERDIKAIRASQTKVEQFESYRAVKSAAWHQARWDTAQHFLDHYVRRNTANLSSVICKETLCPVVLRPGHRVLYDELFSHLLSSPEKIPELHKRFGAVESDRTKRLNELMSGHTSSEEALLGACNTSLPPITELTESRNESRSELETLIKNALQHIQALIDHKQDRTPYDKWLSDLEREVERSETDISKDRSITRELLGFIRCVQNTPKAHNGTALRNSVSEVTQDLQDLTKELQKRDRAQRFANNLQATDKADCAASNCSHKAVAILPACGHVLCKICKATALHLRRCVADGCCATPRIATLLSSFADVGSKYEAIAKLINGLPEDDQVLVFVANDDIMKDVANAFDDLGITNYAIRAGHESGPKFIENFKTQKGEDKRKALLLNLGDESAAGNNLVNANHIIFASPLLKHTQQEYDQAMEQAIGRARRRGQTKVVNIYRFATRGTIEMDILESRERRRKELSEDLLLMSSLDQRDPVATKVVRMKDNTVALVPHTWLDKGEASINRISKRREMWNKWPISSSYTM